MRGSRSAEADEVWFSLVVERDDLAIYDGVLRKVA